MTQSSGFGHWGEDYAALYLQEHGYSVLVRNYHCQRGEIDIIAAKNNELSFVEVKARRNLVFGRPAEAVNKRKQMRIRLTADAYLQECKHFYQCFHFDVIEILAISGQVELNHLRDCF